MIISSFKRKSLVLAVFVLLVAGLPLLQWQFSSQDHQVQSVNQKMDAPFLDGIERSYVILFFGYVGCTDVCSPLLEELHRIYEDSLTPQSKQKIEIVFVNLISEVNPDGVDLFAKSFDGNFRGIYLNRHAIARIERAFRMAISPSFFNPLEVSHSDYVYVLKKEPNGGWTLQTLYTTHPLDEKRLIEEINLIGKTKS